MDILDDDIAEKQALLKKHIAAVNMGRWAVFALLAFLFVRFGRYIYLMGEGGYTISWTSYGTLPQICVASVALTITLLSYKRPYICMLLLSILFCSIGATSIIGTIYFMTITVNKLSPETFLSLGLAMQIGVSVLVVRATVHAKRYARLSKSLIL